MMLLLPLPLALSLLGLMVAAQNLKASLGWVPDVTQHHPAALGWVEPQTQHSWLRQ